ncbi:MAG TPA: type II secretion system F family protein [Candidatus Limnocylindria bacterium]
MSVALAIAALVAFFLAAVPGMPVRFSASLPRRTTDRGARAALPALVEALAAALASGLSLPLAFAEVAPTLPASLASATRRAAASLALGVGIADALAAYERLVPAEDLAPLAIVLRSFSRSGGRVGASLERVATLLRGRLALEEERAALTAQARVSAVVLVALAPLGVSFFAFALPDYVQTLLGEGRFLLALALAFEAAGALWLARIVRATTPPDDLATLLDAVVVGLDAGLTFEHALATLVRQAPDAVRGADARRLLADLSLGAPLSNALARFASRPDEARIAALVGTSLRFGSPLAPLLVTQADALRTTARHHAEAVARRLPVLMLFPLAFCILPALLIVFLGPPLLSLLK